MASLDGQAAGYGPGSLDNVKAQMDDKVLVRMEAIIKLDDPERAR